MAGEAPPSRTLAMLRARGTWSLVDGGDGEATEEWPFEAAVVWLVATARTAAAMENCHNKIVSDGCGASRHGRGLLDIGRMRWGLPGASTSERRVYASSLRAQTVESNAN